MNYYYKDKSLTLKIKGKINNKIILNFSYYKNHIKVKHPEAGVLKIESILIEPDYIYKQSKRSKVYYYEKKIKENYYRVVVKKYNKSVKEVKTAYKIVCKDRYRYTIKHVYCVYDKKIYDKEEYLNKKLENDIDYFYNIFNIAR